MKGGSVGLGRRGRWSGRGLAAALGLDGDGGGVGGAEGGMTGDREQRTVVLAVSGQATAKDAALKRTNTPRRRPTEKVVRGVRWQVTRGGVMHPQAVCSYLRRVMTSMT